MRIVLDAMGSDNRPAPDVEGAVLAAKEYGDQVILVGDEARIKAELARQTIESAKIEIVHASDEVTMDDKPGTVVKARPQSSMHIGMRLVKEGQAESFVTMGNTGAALAIATLGTLRRIPGVKRPALTAIYPVQGRSTIFLDVGANADTKPEWMAQFALMGSLYASGALGYENPRVAILSNGEEEGKGSQLVHEADALIKTMGLHYIGNIEPKEIMIGKADVILMDGFVGNVFIKTFEASVSYLGEIIREELTRTLSRKIGAAIVRPALRAVRKRIDPSEIGGAPLLGVNGVVIIGHGRSDGIAVKNAINQARRAVSGNVIEILRDRFEQLAHHE